MQNIFIRNFKKPTFWLIIAVILICIGITIGFFVSPYDKTSRTPIINNNYSTTFDDVYITLDSVVLDNNSNLDIEVLWHNKTQEKISYNDYFDIEYSDNGNWCSVGSDKNTFTADLFEQNGNSAKMKKYSTNELIFDISKNGSYRLKVEFYIGDKKNTAYSDFEINNQDNSIKNTTNKDVKQQLTAEKLIEISKKGKDISISDFEMFNCIETGSGLSLLVYEIDDMFKLTITLETQSFILSANDASREYIDITAENVEEFIDTHKNNPILTELSAAWNIFPVGYNSEAFSEIVKNYSTSSEMYLSPKEYMPIITVTSREELLRFKKHMDGLLNFDAAYADTNAFNQVQAEYSEEYFKDNNLYLIYTTADKPSYRYSIRQATKQENRLYFDIIQLTNESGEDALEGWLIAVSLSKFDTQHINSTSAYISNKINSDSNLYPMNELIESYTYTDKDNSTYIIVVNLYQNNTFSLVMPLYSSYFATGKYEQVNDSLILTPLDNSDLSFTFIKKDSKLLFDKSNSSILPIIEKLPHLAEFK